MVTLISRPLHLQLDLTGTEAEYVKFTNGVKLAKSSPQLHHVYPCSKQLQLD